MINSAHCAVLVGKAGDVSTGRPRLRASKRCGAMRCAYCALRAEAGPLAGPADAFSHRSGASTTMEYPSAIGYKLHWDRRGNSQECVGAFSMRANFGCHRETGRDKMVMRRKWKTSAS